MSRNSGSSAAGSGRTRGALVLWREKSGSHRFYVPAVAGERWMSARVTGFQEDSVNVVVGELMRASSMMAANEDVMTTRRTVGAERWMADRMDVVPMTAGSMSSVWGSVKWKWKGEAVCRTTSMPGILTTSSKAEGWAMSGTMAMVSSSGDLSG